MSFNEKLQSLLKSDPRFVDQDGDLLKSEVIDKAWKIDRQLIGLLLDDEQIKAKFFDEIKSHWVFNINTFIDYIQDKNFYDSSYTKFRNKIGLTIDGKFLKERGEVALVWPYKDCVLEGGQTKEEEKRKEIFFNEVLAQDEIDRLLEPKVLTSFKRYTVNGEEPVTEFKRDKDGTIRENLIIKGNNLLALHSLKKQIQGKIDLIYIDPPYNPQSNANTFCYNNNFNHSSWLTFLKNRLEISKDLLSKSGALIVAIDDNEHEYLGILLKEIFSGFETHCITIVHNPRGVQGTNFSYTHEYAYFVIPKGKKTINDRIIDKKDINWNNLRNWGSESLRTDAKNCFYPIVVNSKNGEIIHFGNVCSDDFHPGSINILKDDLIEVYPIDQNNIERKWRYAWQSVQEVKNLLRARKKNNVWDIEIGKNFGLYKTVWIDSKYDANEYGTKIVKELVPDCKFDFPKSLYNVIDCVYSVVASNKKAIILDFFAGSGTTGHAVLELNKKDKGERIFILCEQMDYVDTVTKARVKKVLENIGENDFIYCELMQYNEAFIERIRNAENTGTLLEIWEDMKARSFLNYNMDIKAMDANIEEFKGLSLIKQKETLLDILNKNQLYVNLSEIEDQDFEVSEDDKTLNRLFYGE